MSSVHLDTSGFDKVLSGHDKAQTEYAMRAALLCRQYVPREEGFLRDSEPSNSRYERGLLIWNTPYAAYQYYTPLAHTEPGTTDHWDERCWNDHSHELLDYARMLLEG